MVLREDVSDEELRESFQQGDERAFGALLRRYEGPLFAFLYRQTGDVQEAQDLFQETWIRVYRSADLFERGRKFSPWVYRIAYRLSIDSRRRIERQKRGTPGSGEREPVPDTRDIVESRELNQRVKAVLETLGEELRAVVIMKHYQGLTYEEIAEILGCPAGTVKSRMHNAISQLRKRAELDGLLGRERR